MNNSILYIKGSSSEDVRLRKFLQYFTDKKFDVTFWGWKRESNNIDDENNFNSKYLLVGGGFNNIKLFLFYPLWISVLFIKLLFVNKNKFNNIVAIDFESALPVYLVSKIRGIKYIYEIYDDFALRYRMHRTIKILIQRLDFMIMKGARFVIHVDKNRVFYDDIKTIIIENTPLDYYNGKERTYDNLEYKFAVVGYFSKVRGITEIYKFAANNPQIGFLVVGQFFDEQLKLKFKSLPNTEMHEFMLQHNLFNLMKNCCGIFSLYDPAIKINQLAASNKVYDAMMLGIPVITNKEVINSQFILEKKVGIVVNYNFDKTWDVLIEKGFVKTSIQLGRNGKKLYTDEFEFCSLVYNRMLPLLECN